MTGSESGKAATGRVINSTPAPLPVRSIEDHGEPVPLSETISAPDEPEPTTQPEPVEHQVEPLDAESTHAALTGVLKPTAKVLGVSDPDPSERERRPTPMEMVNRLREQGSA